MKEKELSTYSVRTDLAYEAKEMYVEEEKDTTEIKGVLSKDSEVDGIRISDIKITEEGEKTIQKKAGRYVTIFTDSVKQQDTNRQAKAIKVLAEKIRESFVHQ